jgi:uncharacterized protein Smg (DUF494 family)
MEMTLTRLSEILSEAFDHGYEGTEEDREEVVLGILAKHNINEADDKPPQKVKDDEFRIYTPEELKTLPVGATFLHSVLQKCTILRTHDEKYMNFDSPGLAPAAFNVDGYPWDVPMKRLS